MFIVMVTILSQQGSFGFAAHRNNFNLDREPETYCICTYIVNIALLRVYPS